MPSAQSSVVRLETPRDKRRKSASFFLQIVDPLEVVNAVLVGLAHTEHHGGGGAHAELVRRAMDVQPVFCQTLQPRNLEADFVIQNLRATTGDGIEPGIAQAADGVGNAQTADFREVNDLRSREAMQMHFRKTLLDAVQHFFVPLKLQVGMQPALHEHACASKFHGLLDFLVDGFEIQHIAFGAAGALYRSIESAEGAVLGAEIRVINIAVDNVSDHSFRMVLVPDSVRFHADTDQIIGAEQVQSLLFGE